MSLLKARQEALVGHYGLALKALGAPRNAVAADEILLHLDLLERTGQHPKAAALASHLLSSGNLDARVQALSEFVLGRAQYIAGDFDQSIRHFQRSVEVASSAQDLERVCWSQLNLFVRLADFLGRDVPATLLSDLRMNVARSGNPRLTAALHVFVGQVAAQLGQYRVRSQTHDQGSATPCGGT